MSLSNANIGLSATVAGILLFSATPAHSQIWIGQVVGNMMAQQQAALEEHNCMIGTPMPPEEIEETRETTKRAIKGYWQAVMSGNSSAFSDVFHQNKKTSWQNGETKLGLTQLSQISDQFAKAGAQISVKPSVYLRAGDGRTVRGRWAVNDSAGNLIGTYSAEFKRSAGTWRFSNLELLSADTVIYPLDQYCHQPDDVMPYRLKNAAFNLTLAEKRAAKMALKLEKAEAKLVKAEASLAKRDNASKREKVARAREKLAKADEKARDANNKLAEMQSIDEQAKADAKTAEDVRAAIRGDQANAVSAGTN